MSSNEGPSSTRRAKVEELAGIEFAAITLQGIESGLADSHIQSILGALLSRKDFLAGREPRRTMIHPIVKARIQELRAETTDIEPVLTNDDIREAFDSYEVWIDKGKARAKDEVGDIYPIHYRSIKPHVSSDSDGMFATFEYNGKKYSHRAIQSRYILLPDGEYEGQLVKVVRVYYSKTANVEAYAQVAFSSRMLGVERLAATALSQSISLPLSSLGPIFA